MITLEQAKRLKDAGWVQGTTKQMYYEDAYRKIYLVSHFSNDNIADAPSEKEMLEYLTENCRWMSLWHGRKMWEFDCEETKKGFPTRHEDLTEVLVQACEEVLKSVNKKGEMYDKS